MRLLLTLFFFTIFSGVFSQSKTKVDSNLVITTSGNVEDIVYTEKKSPKTASILSAVLPGAGHIYIKKYHKTAIIWAGLGAGIYGYSFNQRFFKEHKEAYIALLDGDPTTNPTGEYENGSAQGLKDGMDFYRRNRDLSIILTSLGYVLNILWASVDTHLLYFDVSEDISLNIRPSFMYDKKPISGLTLALTLK